ncbi:MAG: hypothetical protein ACC657_18155 [Thiohalomonadales bacterium]
MFNSIGINSSILSTIAYGRFQENDYRDINFVDKIITIPDIPTKDKKPKNRDKGKKNYKD